MADDRELRIGRVPDSRRVKVPAHIVRGLANAIIDMEEARLRRDRLIVEALMAGCSLRDVGDVANLAPSRVRGIGNDHGWPPPEVQEARREALREIRKHRERILGGLDAQLADLQRKRRDD